jgi:hypothetical protein
MRHLLSICLLVFLSACCHGMYHQQQGAAKCPCASANKAEGCPCQSVCECAKSCKCGDKKMKEGAACNKKHGKKVSSSDSSSGKNYSKIMKSSQPEQIAPAAGSNNASEAVTNN